MQFFEPGPYDEYVGKLSTIRVVPKREVWTGIDKHLDNLESKRRRIAFWKSSAAVASVLLIFSASFAIISSSSKDFETFAYSDNAFKIIAPPINHSIIIPPRGEALMVPVESQSRVKLTPIEVPPASTNKANSILPISALPTRSLVSSANVIAQGDINLTYLTKEVTPGKVEIDKVEPSSNKHWGLRAYLNPLYSNHTMAAMTRTINPNESGVWLWGGELQVKRSLGKIFSFVTGITVNPTGQNIDNLILLHSGNVSRDIAYLFANTSYGQVTLESPRVGISNLTNLSKAPDDVLKSSSLTTATLKQRFHHIEIPLLLSAKLSTGNIDFDFRIGAALGVLVNNQFEVLSSFGQFAGQTDGVKRYNAAGIGAISIAVPITKQVSFVVEPYFRVGLLTLDYHEPNSYPFNASVRFGVGYKF